MSTAGKNAREKLLYDRARLGNKAVSGVLSQLAVVDLRVRHDPPLTTKHPQPLDHLRIGRELGLNGACPVERVPMVRVQAHSEGHIVTTRRRDHQLSVCRSAMRPSRAVPYAAVGLRGARGAAPVPADASPGENPACARCACAISWVGLRRAG